jgi:glycosyltransferase involved in cell wall biosynthesis
VPCYLRAWSGGATLIGGRASSRRVLVIGAIWPYHSGGARVSGLAKYLPECGWEPVVLTQPLPSGANLPYRVEMVGGDAVGASLARGMRLEGEGGPRRRLARKLHMSSENVVLKRGFQLMREVLQYPDGYRMWRQAALERALQLVGHEHFDAVISTSPPVSCHLIAAELKRRYGLTWIADFPHLWSQDHGVPYGRIRRSFDRRLEIRTLAGADALTTTNAAHARIFAMLHGAARVHAISHGFDPDTVNEPPVPLAEKFTMTYTGGFAKGVREPRLLLEAVAGLVADGVLDRDRVEINFYGSPQDWVQNQIDQYGLGAFIHQRGQAPQSAAFERQREAHVLLNIKCNYDAEVGILSSKVLEYIAARRPVISVGEGADVTDEIVVRSRSGEVAANSDQLAEYLLRLYREWSDSGFVRWRGATSVVDLYSQRNMACLFAGILDSSA